MLNIIFFCGLRKLLDFIEYVFVFYKSSNIDKPTPTKADASSSDSTDLELQE